MRIDECLAALPLLGPALHERAEPLQPYVTSGRCGQCRRIAEAVDLAVKAARYDELAAAAHLIDTAHDLAREHRAQPSPDGCPLDGPDPAAGGGHGSVGRWPGGDTTAMPEGYSLRPRIRTGQPTVRLAERVAALPGVSFRHVKGHAHHPLNEAADALSSMARRRVGERFNALERAHSLVDAFLDAWHTQPAVPHPRRTV